MARRERTSGRSRKVFLWLGIVVVFAIGVAYVQPIRAYFDTREEVSGARAERTALLRKQGELRHRLELAGTDEFMEREARKLGFVRPGERLFVVQGLDDLDGG